MKKKKTSLCPREIGDKLNINWDKFSLAQFKQGLKVEQEHKDVTKGDPLKTGKIVLAHLKELPNYYTRLKKMENKNGSKKIIKKNNQKNTKKSTKIKKSGKK